MTIENQNFDMKSKVRKNTLSDRNYLIRSQVKPKYLTHDIVADFIDKSLDDDNLKSKILIKLKKCPDGALQNFIDNFDKNVSLIIEEMSPKPEKKDLHINPKEITVDDMNAMRNSLSEQSGKEFENESSPD
jgi:hypothetical protein